MTKSDQAYEALRRAIVEGSLREEQALDEVKLSAEFGLGRTPLREALKHLALEQFITWPAHRTPFVRGVRVIDLNRIYEARLLLELPAARLAAERRTAADVSDLARIMDEMRVALDQGQIYEAVELDHRFHLRIAQASDNRFLSEAVDRLNCGSLRLWFQAHHTLGTEDIHRNHVALFDAIADRDPDAAEAAADHHIRNSYDRQIQRLQIALSPAPIPRLRGAEQ